MLAGLTCANGQIAKWNGSVWACAADNDTTYASGTGLNLASGQFSISTPYQLPQSCISGQIPSWNGTSWTCAADANNAYAAGTGLSLVGGQFSLSIPYQLPQSCTSGQIPSWNGTSWTCAVDNIGTDWSRTGNNGTTAGTNFIGTTDNQPLEFRVNNLRVLRIEPSATGPNIIGGFNGNVVTPNTVGGATIGGGGAANSINQVTASYGTIGGGQGNTATGAEATIGGGATTKPEVSVQ